MCFYSRLDLMIDRPHRQHVLELAEPPLDLAQFLVDRHHLEHAQARLTGRNHIFALDPILAPQACRVLEVPEARLVDIPRVVAVSPWASGWEPDATGTLGQLGRRAVHAFSL